MKAKWGSCYPEHRAIRLNTELAKKRSECLEYLVVHELVHLREPNHGPRFRAIMDEVMPLWREHRDVLNEAPLAHVDRDY
jgi:predicted metal-dependent hydrolase